jgi:hypothetical protein
MKPVYYIGPFIPPEWIAAYGFAPRRMQLSANHRDRGVRPGLCPYADALMNGRNTLDGAPIIVAITCDQMRRAVEWMLDDCEKTSHPGGVWAVGDSPALPCLFAFSVPATNHSDSRDWYRQELARLGRFLVDLGGNQPSSESPVCGTAHIAVSRRPLRRAEPEGIPLAIVGGPLLIEHVELFEVIERCGGHVALDGSEGIERTRPNFHCDRFLYDDALEILTRAYFDTIPDAFRRPGDILDRWLTRRLEECPVKGIIFYSYVWCDLWRAKQRHLAAIVSMPALFLELGSETPLQPRTIDRVEAFLETLR